MKKLLAPLVAIAFGLASISAFAATAPAKESTAVAKVHKRAVKKVHRSHKKWSHKKRTHKKYRAKAHKKTQAQK